MVKTIIRYLQLVCALALLGSVSLRAKDISAYVIGDKIEEDIKAPFALDLIDPKLTAVKRSEDSLRTPVIFRNYSSITNESIAQFQTDFTKTRRDFLAAVNAKYGTSTLDDQTIAAADFDQVVAAFNRSPKAKNLPITSTLAKLWAKGDSGSSVQMSILGRLAEALRRPIVPDELPIEVGDSVKIVFMKDPQETLNLAEADARGKLGGPTSYRKLASAKNMLKKAFPDDEQLMVKALSNLVKPTCFVDET